MRYLLHSTFDNISSLRHFYDTQKKYIDGKAKKGMKDNRIGFLADFYFSVLVNGTEEERKKSTFVNLKKFIDKYITVKEVTEASVIYQINDRDAFPHFNVARSAKEYRQYLDMPIAHCNNTLIMLITRFEEFISDFIRLLYERYPQKYLDKQTITFSEISHCETCDIKEKIIVREIDRIMRDSYSVWFNLFSEHKMNFEVCNSEYEILKELYARRNIIVHNSGVVNEAYIKNVPTTTANVGEVLYVDDIYINSAFEAIKTIMLCILIEGVRIDKDSAKECIREIFYVTFEELEAENYNTCKTVFGALSENKFADERIKYMSKVNYWISRIETDGLPSVKAEIEKFDVSALDSDFNLAKNTLLQNYNMTTMLLEEMYKKGELLHNIVELWPLFKQYRLSKEYINFKKTHPEFSGTISLEPVAENLMQNEEATNNMKTELADAKEKKNKRSRK